LVVIFSSFFGFLESSWREILGGEPEGIRGEDAIFLKKFAGKILAEKFREKKSSNWGGF